MDGNVPSWLKSVQNGSLGEARAKAFLLNRFWVLERSIDIDGADFIIQRRLTDKTLLDETPPRLGVIQVKFYGSPSTTHYVQKRYVLNSENEPQTEFFLLCFFGDEDNQKISLVASDDIAHNFPLTDDNGVEKYRISFSSIADDKHTLTSIGSGLGRIERALIDADFRTNRRFLSWALPSVRADLGAIEPIYHEPIGNWYGDLPKRFEKIKESARSAMFDIENIYALFSKLCLEPNPLNAEKILKELSDYCGYDFSHFSISQGDRLYDEDFFNACSRHKLITSTLNENNMLDAYLDLKRKIISTFFDTIRNKLPIDRNKICVARIDYELSSLKFISLDMQYFYEGDDSVYFNSSDYEGINDITDSRIELYLMPSRFGGIDHQDIEGLYEKYLGYGFTVFTTCMDQIFKMRFDVDLD